MLESNNKFTKEELRFAGLPSTGSQRVVIFVGTIAYVLVLVCLALSYGFLGYIYPEHIPMTETSVLALAVLAIGDLASVARMTGMPRARERRTLLTECEMQDKVMQDKAKDKRQRRALKRRVDAAKTLEGRKR